MECVMKQQTVRSARKIVDTFDEKPFDGDFVLPDYLPEMAAVLSCRLEPVIENQQLGANRLIVDGTTHVRILYVDDSRCRLFTYEATQPFSSTFNTDSLTEPATVSLHATVSYINYRAIGPRRLDVRGAFRICATVYDTVSIDLPRSADDDTLCLRRCTLEHSLPAQCNHKIFTVNEVLDLGGQTATKVLSCHATATVSECKVLPDRAIIKGEVSIHTLYEAAGNDNETPDYGICDHTLLYSQVIDGKGLTDRLLAACCVMVLSCDVHADREEGTGRNVLLANLRLAATLNAWENAETTYIADAYSTRCPADAALTNCAAVCYGGITTRRLPIRQELELPEGVDSVVDLWCDCVSVGYADGVATHRLVVHLLATAEDGTFSCYERTVDFDTPLNVIGNMPQYDLRIWECDYRQKDAGVLEIAIVVELTVQDMTTENYTAVCGVAVDDLHPYHADTAAVRMLFAEAGESIWQIAKDCHRDAAAILAENELGEGDRLSEKRVLLIPLK